MNQAIKPGPVPPVRGLEKEEPEFSIEDDIPRDDDPAEAVDETSGESRE
jgi:hypothetical protein